VKYQQVSIEEFAALYGGRPNAKEIGNG